MNVADGLAAANANAGAPPAANLNASVAAAVQEVAALVLNGVSNGGIAANNLNPLAGRIEPYMYTTLAPHGDGAAVVQAPIEQAICYMTGCNLEAMPNGRPSIQAAVCVILGRQAAARVIANFTVSLNRAETHALTAAEMAHVVHANHVAAVSKALDLFAPVASRLVPILSYNGAMIQTYGHCHIPDANSRLTRTTMKLSPVYAFLDSDPTMASAVFHDMYHNVSGAIISAACREHNYIAAAGDLGYNNLEKRLPVKMPDTAIAVNYRALHLTASSMVPVQGGIPATFAPPVRLATAIAAANAAAAGQPLIDATAVVREMSTDLTPASLFMAGYILGRLRQTVGDPELTIKQAVKSHRVTILGSNFIDRERGSGAGLAMFEAGVAMGIADPTQADTAGARISAINLGEAGVASAAAR